MPHSPHHRPGARRRPRRPRRRAADRPGRADAPAGSERRTEAGRVLARGLGARDIVLGVGTVAGGPRVGHRGRRRRRRRPLRLRQRLRDPPRRAARHGRPGGRLGAARRLARTRPRLIRDPGQARIAHVRTRVAIVGSGIAGLTAAHRLHPQPRGHALRGGRLRQRPHEHDPVEATAAHRRRRRLHRARRPHLPAPRAGCWTSSGSRPSRRTWASGLRPPRLRVRGAAGPVRHPRRPPATRLPPHARRPGALQPRGARAARANGDGPSLATSWTTAATGALRRAPGRARRRPPSGPPIPRRCGRSPHASWRFFNNHGFLSMRDRPRWISIPGARDYVGPDRAPSATAALGTPVDGRSTRRPARRGDTAAASRRASTRSCRLPRRPGARAARGSHRGLERELLGAIPYQGNEAVLHTDARLLRAGEVPGPLELPPRRAQAAWRPLPTA